MYSGVPHARIALRCSIWSLYGCFGAVQCIPESAQE